MAAAPVDEEEAAPLTALAELEPVAVEVPVFVPVLVATVVVPLAPGLLDEPVAELLPAPVLVGGDIGTTGLERPAGMEAAGTSEVTTDGCEVTTPGCDVTGIGWPVTTPRELVSVRNLVAGFSYLYVSRLASSD
jgi:hypothetical protein